MRGVGGGVGGTSPPGSPLAGSPVTRNAEIDPPPAKMTQGVMTPQNPPSSPSTASLSAIFLRPTEQICPDSAGPFIVSILLALLFSLFWVRIPEHVSVGHHTDEMIVLSDWNSADIVLAHQFCQFGDRSIRANPVDALMHRLFNFHGGPP